jgi:hypothetical protein
VTGAFAMVRDTPVQDPALQADSDIPASLLPSTPGGAKLMSVGAPNC